MVDTRGAVLLDALVPTVEVDTGQDAPLLDPAPGFAAALRLLFAASVLQAFTIHVSRERGERFDVDTRDIGSLTVAQLASLFRQHDGTAG
ncbi:hypothetical protein GB931_16985 [Modestobacter sp. I12A-02628]|uniref:Uncharacterized protein n=1 Tax=Goekera deserti TaxID=2497753 RepID=A0A7K3WDV7_9ACTN|nr:hypothetical protein [Goekera deserti]MPQ99580.1 hypothetical protein [Goekera deserti]NDI46409.1 hypothetical protein [Goekera deserti]NEL54658.1 hypothetical protein [Goekera deserti]